ncbi:hypothetical protein TrLO_g13728 [Triparma laevis f. longispina]|uniref:Uncharacterized protein n=1 Tax=Triparma laevis f. longispina TaxID=1714387 RepID=A0A9W7ALH3_9STRA|nr:hypothetical protein TrLO_g13728 [Triparma laevis f. longispina]
MNNRPFFTCVYCTPQQQQQQAFSTSIPSAFVPPSVTGGVTTYYAECQKVGSKPNPGVITTMKYGNAFLRPSNPFGDRDCIAMVEYLKTQPELLTSITRIDLTQSTLTKLPGVYIRGIRSQGAVALGTVLRKMTNVETLKLDGNKIGPYGLRPLLNNLPPSLTSLSLRQCSIREPGAQLISELVVKDLESKIDDLDLSLNGMGHFGIGLLAASLRERQLKGGRRMIIDVDGNQVFQETMNAVTHGLGIVLCIIGTVLMSRKAAEGQKFLAGVYSVSLLTLYFSSTLYHSFFALKRTKMIFGIFDHCAIYILIAGSYTPFLGITFPDEMWAHYLLGFLWVCCFAGVGVEAFFLDWKYKSKFSLTMYLAMGWSAMTCLPNLNRALPQEAITLLILGGLGYTCGVPFFVRNNNLDHSVWHLFVVSGSLAHWLAVYWYVLELKR